MSIVRQKLEAALRAHERLKPQYILEALEHLGKLEYAAAKWEALDKPAKNEQ